MSVAKRIGIDPHLDFFVAAVIDSMGQQVDQRRCDNTDRGFAETARLCRRHGLTEVGIEGASGHGRALATFLQAEGFRIIDVSSRVTAAGRDKAGKTDPGDAVTVARAMAADRGHLWGYDPESEALRVIVHRRERLVRTQTADINQLRALLTELDPKRAAQMGRLRSLTSFRKLTRVSYRGNPHRETVAATIREIASGCLVRARLINQLTRQLPDLLPEPAHRMINDIKGCGVVTAAILFAELAGTTGFDTPARFASWTGTAPIPVSSGRTDRHRLNRGGNRQANRALHTIIITQHRHGGETRDYINKRISGGKTRKEAIRCAKRHLARRLWKHYLNPNN